MAKKDFTVRSENCGTIRNGIETREEAIEIASQYASSREENITVYEAICIVKPQRAPVEVVTL